MVLVTKTWVLFKLLKQWIFIEWQQILYSKNIAGNQQKLAVSPGLIKAKNNCKARSLQDCRKDCMIRSIQTQEKPNSHTLQRENWVWQLKGWPILNIYPLTSFTLPHLHSKSLLIPIWGSVIILSKPSTVYLVIFTFGPSISLPIISVIPLGREYHQSSVPSLDLVSKAFIAVQPMDLQIDFLWGKKPPFMHQLAMDGEVIWNWLGII